jgi:hypothetical protein
MLSNAVTRGLSWFQPWAVRPTGVCSWRCIAMHRGARRGELQARRERRRNLQVPEGWLRLSANIVGEGGDASELLSVVIPRGQGTTSSFYRARRCGLQSHRVALSPACGSMTYNVVELTSVLANLASGRRRDRSCDRPGAAWRVVASGLLFDRRPYANSRAWLTEDRRLHSGGRGDCRCFRPATYQGEYPR